MVAIYIPLIILAAIGAALFMDNLTQNSNAKGAIREVTRHRETWIMALLYIGTFGSFIGFGFAFGQVLLVQFPEQFPRPGQGGRADLPRAAARLADPALRRRAGRPVQGLGGDVLQLHRHGAWARSIVLIASQLNSLPVFLIGFVMLFVFSGIGNGSTYKMIPMIFHAKAQLEVGAGVDVADADKRAIRRAGALIGLAGAIGALGGVMVNLAFRQSFLTLKNGDGAYIAFIAFYAICFVVT